MEINNTAQLPEGWLATRRELNIEEMSGAKRLFVFEVERMAAGDLKARCQMCHRIINTHLDSLRKHGYRHAFLQIPFDADEGNF